MFLHLESCRDISFLIRLDGRSERGALVLSAVSSTSIAQAIRTLMPTVNKSNNNKACNLLLSFKDCTLVFKRLDAMSSLKKKWLPHWNRLPL